MDRIPTERWQRIDSTFAAALERPPTERLAFLERACAGDEDMYHEIKALLDCDLEAANVLGESATDFAAPLISGMQADLTSETAPLATGQRVGPYRILEEIGRGGMGAVYRAERADEQFEQRIALKLVKRGMDTDEILTRFRYERQILASLEHPHIARLLDGGVTEDGLPYLVLEYVEGQPIDRYCDEHRLGIEERLALFRTVCQAVQYAHQNLVVHRDVKPSNILVTAEGDPKLLDFGIAKLLEDSPLADTPHTRTGLRIMTPEYASPEQIRGAPVTVASDVYALGVLLYQLLTGLRPFNVASTSSYDAERAVLEQEPERPSTVVVRAAERTERDERCVRLSIEAVAAVRSTTPDRLRRSLRGDLDTIVLKALEKEPARRYQSVQQLLEDLERHRDGLPVIARAATIAYRTAKFVRRHRMGVAAAAAFGLLLTGSVAALTVQQAETVRERDRAEQERDKAEEVAAFLEGLFAASDPFAPEPERIDTLRVRDFLNRGATKIQQEFEGQPLVKTQMLDVIGRVYRSLGLYDQARLLLEQAVAQRRTLLDPQDPELAESLTNLAMLLMNTGDYDQAHPLFEEALAINAEAFGPQHPAVAGTVNDLGSLLREEGLYDEAERRHMEALTVLRQAGEDRTSGFAVVLGDLVTTLERKGDRDAAEQHSRVLLALQRSLYGDNHLRVALGLRELALLLQRKGDYDEAEMLSREALSIAKQTLGEEHPQMAEFLNRLASILRWKRDFDAAEPLFSQSLALKRKLYGDTHLEVAVGLYNLASLLREKGDFDAAEALNREALTIAHRSGGEDHPYVGIYRGGVAATLAAKGDCVQAEPLFRDAIARMRRTLSADRLRIPAMQSWLGRCLIPLGRYAEAETLLLEAHDALRPTRGDPLSFTRESLVRLYTAWGKPDEAAEYRSLLAVPGS